MIICVPVGTLPGTVTGIFPLLARLTSVGEMWLRGTELVKKGARTDGDGDSLVPSVHSWVNRGPLGNMAKVHGIDARERSYVSVLCGTVDSC